jgi:hypothetical protein
MARVALVLCVVTLLSFSQATNPPTEDDKEAAKSEITSEPQVILSLPGAKVPLVAWRPQRFQVSVVNGSLPAGTGILEMQISVPQSLAATQDNSPAGKIVVPDAVVELRTPGERYDFDPVELRPKSLAEVQGQLGYLLTYRPQREVVVVSVEYQALDEEFVRKKTTQFEFNVAPNPLGIYVGAVLGAFLMALLIVINRLRNQTLSQADLRQGLLTIMGRTFMGAVATGIGVFLLQTTSDFSFPISISVRDFYGGVLLGLGADLLAMSLIKKFVS